MKESNFPNAVIKFCLKRLDARRVWYRALVLPVSCPISCSATFLSVFNRPMCQLILSPRSPRRLSSSLVRVARYVPALEVGASGFSDTILESPLECCKKRNVAE